MDVVPIRRAAGPRPAVALVFPPLWYYASVPADLLYTGSHLAAHGVPVRTFDLSARFTADALGATAGWQAFRRPETYADRGAYRDATADVAAACERVSHAHGVGFDFSHLRFPDIDEGHVPSGLEVGLDETRNPALATLRAAVARILADDPAIVAIALVHPDQIVQAPVLGRLLRAAGYEGFLCLYGAHEDVVAPEDFAEDLVGDPPHVLFRDFDGVIVGEAETPLLRLWEAVTGRISRAAVPGLLAPRWGLAALPRGTAEDVAALAPLDASLVDPSLYPYPAPVVDLRLSRSCPWGRCLFCAITLHQQGYRARATSTALAEMEEAHRRLGTRFFRFRDDLLTPEQLRELAKSLPSLPFRPRWSARARFEAGFDGETLRAAAAAGLEELWLGLESASARVRNLMVKGVSQRVVERILADAADAGIRVRALCMAGYPGETPEEIRETFGFLLRHVFRVSTVSLTPFQLMRMTPLARDPAAHGLTLLPEALPREERLRFSLEATGPGVLSAAERQAFHDEAVRVIGGWFAADTAGPTLSHAWMRASIARQPWDSA